MPGHQLPQPLPPFADFWATLDEMFGWLAGEDKITVPPRAERADLGASAQARRT